MKKRILFILPSLVGGGAEKTVCNLTIGLIDYYDIDIIVFRNTDIKYKYKGNLIVLPNGEKKGKFNKIKFCKKSLSIIKQLKKKNKYDFSISFLTTADFLNVLTKVKGTKNIISIRNTDSIYNKGLTLILTRFNCKKADKIVAISKQVKEDLINNFGIDKNKIHVIYNPAITIRFDENNNLTNIPKTDFIINFGRMTEQKGQEYLIKSFAIVHKKLPKLKLVIMGDGPLKEKLKIITNKLGLTDFVIFTGFVDNPYTYLKKSKIFVFSSLYEGLGNSILEALSYSIPVISTDCISGPREILAPKTNFHNKTKNKIDYAEYGVLIPNFDKNSNNKLQEKLLADAIIKLITNKDLLNNYSKKSKERSNDFTLEKITIEWIDFLENKIK